MVFWMKLEYWDSAIDVRRIKSTSDHVVSAQRVEFDGFFRISWRMEFVDCHKRVPVLTVHGFHSSILALPVGRGAEGETNSPRVWKGTAPECIYSSSRWTRSVREKRNRMS